MTAIDQTIPNLTQRLIKEETQLTAADETTSALTAISLKQRNGGSRGGRPRQEGDTDRGKYKNYDCHYCHNKGHIARDCRKRRNDQKHHDEKKRDVNDKREKRDGSDKRKSDSAGLDAFIASSDIPVADYVNADDAWFSDSGAWQHMSFRKEWFMDFEACDGITVSLGDNSLLKVEGRGTIPVKKLVNGSWQNGRL